jgi:hypothetical protein
MSANPDFNPDSFSATALAAKTRSSANTTSSSDGRQREDDRGVVANFYLDKVLLGFKSREAGREIYEDREFVSIRVKGQDKMEVVREVTEQDKQRFATAVLPLQARPRAGEGRHTDRATARHDALDDSPLQTKQHQDD